MKTITQTGAAICVLALSLYAMAQAAVTSASPVSAGRKLIMEDSLRELRRSEILKHAPRAGDRLPPFTLKDIDNQTVSLAKLLQQGPVVVSFYRGSWCPYCNLQLRSYQAAVGQIRALGAQLVAISPERSTLGKDFRSKEKFDFAVLVDDNNQYAKKLDLVFTLSPKLRKVYLDMGIDLEKSQANADWQLPVPATFIVKPDGRIAYAFMDVDYKLRAPIETVLSELKKLKK